MSIIDGVPMVAVLKAHGVIERDRWRCFSWWALSKPGETMLLVRAERPHLRIDHDGNVTEAEPPENGWFTRTSTLS